MSKEEVLNKLDESQIDYQLINHIPIYTIEEANNLAIENKEYIVKNLFLRDDKKRNYYLVVIKSHKKVNLNDLMLKINSRRLSFASEKDLEKFLCLKKGSVTPLGVLNDSNNLVTVIFDEDIINDRIIGIHPNTNDATIFMNVEDLLKIIKTKGNKVISQKI